MTSHRSLSAAVAFMLAAVPLCATAETGDTAAANDNAAPAHARRAPPAGTAAANAPARDPNALRPDGRPGLVMPSDAPRTTGLQASGSNPNGPNGAPGARPQGAAGDPARFGGRDPSRGGQQADARRGRFGGGAVGDMPDRSAGRREDERGRGGFAGGGGSGDSGLRGGFGGGSAGGAGGGIGGGMTRR